MQVVGQKIAQLEARKRAAVEKEDYDTAKLIKVGSVCSQQGRGGGLRLIMEILLLRYSKLLPPIQH